MRRALTVKFIAPPDASKWRMHGGGALCAPSVLPIRKGADSLARLTARARYLRCLLTIFVMSNIET